MSGDIADPSEYKVYWFSRDLVASRFGSYAGKEADALRELAEELEAELEREGTRVADHEQIIEDRILDSVTRIYAGDISKRYRQTEDLVERIQRRIDSVDDIRDFVLASRSVVRTSEMLDETPRFDSDDIERIVGKTLVSQDDSLDPDLAYDALYEVDFEGEALQLGAQREPLINYVSELMEELQSDASGVSDAARVVSGIAQEYERRAGQSRASTAGNVLETALQHVFDRVGVPATGVPEHFGDIEVDNIAEGPDGKIGFSCKRTLRERFRQSLSRQAEIGVDEIWFVALMVADVSREKLVDIRNDGGRMYVPRDSFVWERYSDDEELEYVLRPADDFLTDVSEFTGSQLEY